MLRVPPGGEEAGWWLPLKRKKESESLGTVRPGLPVFSSPGTGEGSVPDVALETPGLRGPQIKGDEAADYHTERQVAAGAARAGPGALGQGRLKVQRKWGPAQG